MGWCQVPGCLTGRRDQRKAKIFLMPSDPQLKMKWIRKIRRQGWRPQEKDGICALHFEPVSLRAFLDDREHPFEPPILLKIS